MTCPWRQGMGTEDASEAKPLLSRQSGLPALEVKVMRGREQCADAGKDRLFPTV